MTDRAQPASYQLTWATARATAADWDPPLEGGTVFVVPHPDDEILIMGGLLARQLEAGAAVTVVAVTDGEAAYPGLAPEPVARTRRREQESALAHLAGRHPAGPHPPVAPGVIRLGLPDGQVAEHEPQLVDALQAAVGHPALIVAPWAYDHHTDHEAVGRAAAVVAAQRSTVLAAGLFWAWTHTAPAPGLRRLAIPDEHQDRRREALAHHRSQLVGPDGTTPPILASADLEPLQWRHEYYFAGRP